MPARPPISPRTTWEEAAPQEGSGFMALPACSQSKLVNFAWASYPAAGSVSPSALAVMWEEEMQSLDQNHHSLPQEGHNEVHGEDTFALAVPILVLLNHTNLLSSELHGEEDLNLQKTRVIHNINI
ncbi:hypothetical protein P7K49_016382 [Saguinus oedipus]|uniref:Uncharacterized protein n=1 Tax=Saguinus oedipus TaxID=9490 RepID=A0ABQ9VDW7_SAGOE|nr:hypothetical protein P7K49_016382 [Saguinus oedipus]